MQTRTKRLKVLLSAYACEPNRGSEPGVGWEWASRMPEFHELTVLTRSNNRTVIEAAYGGDQPTGRARFLYLDLHPWIQKLKKRRLFPIFLYYLIWQLAAARWIKSQTADYDIIHHVTFNGFRFPGAWWSHDATVILGPLGGGSIAAPQYRRCYGVRWITEKIRELSIRFWRLNPWTMASLRNARMVLVVGEDLQRRFRSSGIQAEMMLETALPRAMEEDITTIDPKDRRDFIWVGNLEPWKAWQIALQAFARAVSNGVGSSKLRIVGKGDQAAEAVRTAERLGISERVEFMEQLPRHEVWRLMATSRALVFSSVRDTSGNVVLEAMGLCCPIICFKHQGVAMMTDDLCAFRVDPGTWNDSVQGFADAMVSLANNDKLVEDMGNAGRSRALREFTWNAKVGEMLEIYSSVS